MKRKFEVWQPLILSLVMILGMYVGYRFARTQPNSKIFTSNKSTALQEALDIIRTKYVDSVNMDTLEAGAITQMMSKLDPHSVYLPPVERKEAEDDLSYNFDGIGVEFNTIRDTVNITYVIPGGPSDKAGLQIGDQIAAVNGKNITGKKISTTEIVRSIKGEKGSVANLDIIRRNKPLQVAVTRGKVAKPSLVAAYMMDKQTGYIKLNEFIDNTYREFMQAMEGLKKQGLQQLVFDLRGNGGGYMEPAINIVDEFLSGDKLIVFTQGTNSTRQEYRCKRPGIFETGKLVILVDELSASASEIVSGALQDWDRATIIGRRTFGKGLVQEPFLLSDGSALRLTVSRYYTPLGRSIQRPYEQGKKLYIDEIYQRYTNGQAYYADSNKVNNGKAYKTPAGRTLYGSGGIMPDVFVGLDTSKASREINRLFYSGSFNDFLLRYYLNHQNILDPYNSPQQYATEFDPSNDMWLQFSNWAKKDSINLAHVSAAEKQRVEDRMEAYLARFKWRDRGYYQILNTKDPTVLKALEKLKQ